jgi:hypothetical protein
MGMNSRKNGRQWRIRQRHRGGEVQRWRGEEGTSPFLGPGNCWKWAMESEEGNLLRKWKNEPVRCVVSVGVGSKGGQLFGYNNEEVYGTVQRYGNAMD